MPTIKDLLGFVVNPPPGDKSLTASRDQLPDWIVAGSTGGTGWYNVRTYGAVGNGGADDTAPIQSAISDAFNNGGGTVYFPNGDYVISAPLTQRHSVRLLGQSIANSEISVLDPAVPAAVYAHEVEGASIEELKINGPGSGTGQGVHYDRNLTPTLGINYRINMRRVMINGFGGDGLHVEQGIVSNFDTVEVRSCGGYGFNFEGYPGGSGSSGTSINFVSCYANANALAGYRIYNMTYCNLEACASDSCGAGYRIDLSGAIGVNGCGVEAPINTNSTYPGDGFQINQSTGVTLNGAFAYEVVRHGALVTGSAGVILNGFRQFNDAGGGVNSVNFQSSSGVVASLSHNLPVSYDGASKVTQLDVNGSGEIGPGNVLTATGPVGTIIGKFQVTNQAGTIVGFVPIYGSIT